MDNWVVLWVVAFQDYTVETLSPKKKKRKRKEKKDLQSILSEALSITTFAVTLKVGKLGVALQGCNRTVGS